MGLCGRAEDRTGREGSVRDKNIDKDRLIIIIIIIIIMNTDA